MRVLNREQKRIADRDTMAGGVSSRLLMEEAGRRVCEAIDAYFQQPQRVAILAGRGNNGGDGWVVARLLHARGVEIDGFLFARGEDVTGDAKVCLDQARAAGVPIVEVVDEATWDRHGPEVGAADVVVDALVGSGLNKPLDGLLAAVAHDLEAADSPVLAVDVPSGLSGDSARPIGPHVRATVTVTFGSPTLPLMLRPASDAAGRVVVADIGIPPGVIAGLPEPRVEVVTADMVRSLVPPRPRDTHKGACGRILVVAGGQGTTGAAQLAGLGALRGGAGLVTVATPISCLDRVSHVPEYMTYGLPEREGTVSGDGLASLLERPFDGVAAGPGLGTGRGSRILVETLLGATSSTPLVLDADGLNVLVDDVDSLRGREDRPVIITPHPGELARLMQTTTAAIQQDRLGAAREFATSHQLYVILKGDQTIIATPSGAEFVNTTGNPGMATGGSGDVLTGVVGAWLGQVADVGAALRVAVYTHGQAGDLAAAALGETGLIASDIAAYLGRAVADTVRSDAGT